MDAREEKQKEVADGLAQLRAAFERVMRAERPVGVTATGKRIHDNPLSRSYRKRGVDMRALAELPKERLLGLLGELAGLGLREKVLLAVLTSRNPATGYAYSNADFMRLAWLAALFPRKSTPRESSAAWMMGQILKRCKVPRDVFAFSDGASVPPAAGKGQTDADARLLADWVAAFGPVRECEIRAEAARRWGAYRGGRAVSHLVRVIAHKNLSRLSVLYASRGWRNRRKGGAA